jgi:hypothetical protein
MDSTPFADAGERHLLVKTPPSGREDPAGAVEVALAEMAGIVADLVAERVLERVTPLLGTDSAAEELVDAREIARRTGRSRWWVYEHAPGSGVVTTSKACKYEGSPHSSGTAWGLLPNHCPIEGDFHQRKNRKRSVRERRVGSGEYGSWVAAGVGCECVGEIGEQGAVL